MISPKLVRSCCSSVLLPLLAGCVTPAGGVALRPDGTPGQEACSEEARKAMNYLRMFVGEATLVQIDANQSASPITLYDGPIESMLEDNLGLLDAPSRLYGCVLSRALDWDSCASGPTPHPEPPSSITPTLGSSSWIHSDSHHAARRRAPSSASRSASVVSGLMSVVRSHTRPPSVVCTR
jgi:hypothetical protein